MANNDYEIEYSNKKDSILVKENLIDNDSTSLSLVGHGQPTYGVAQNTNFLHLLENFASNGTDDEPEPQHPVIGQIWFHNLGGGKFELKVCSELSNSGEPTWSKMSQVITSTSGTNYSNGDLYYDKDSKKLKVFDEIQGWIAVGPTDVLHTEHVFNSILVAPRSQTASYDGFDMSAINENIKETGDENVEGSGSLNLVKMTIMAKEFKENGGTLTPSLAQCCTWLYKFVIRSVKQSADTFKIDMVGAPSYELIAKNPSDLNWDVNIELNQMSGVPQLIINYVFNTPTNNYVLIGMDSEVTRI